MTKFRVPYALEFHQNPDAPNGVMFSVRFGPFTASDLERFLVDHIGNPEFADVFSRNLEEAVYEYVQQNTGAGGAEEG